jgi:hypothetical protein
MINGQLKAGKGNDCIRPQEHFKRKMPKDERSKSPVLELKKAALVIRMVIRGSEVFRN